MLSQFTVKASKKAIVESICQTLWPAIARPSTVGVGGGVFGEEIRPKAAFHSTDRLIRSPASDIPTPLTVASLRERLFWSGLPSSGVFVEKQVRPIVHHASLDMSEIADNLMRENRPEDAFTAYQVVWSELQRRQRKLSVKQQVWLLLSIANAAVRCGDFEEAAEVLAALPEGFSDSEIVEGNPLFHLLVGLSLHGLDEDPETEADNFARALICGGPEIFAGEDPGHLQRTMEVLLPPAETETWEGYVGCSRDLLNDATGYLRELLTIKYGSPPPYE